VLANVRVEHELGERAMQAGNGTLHQRKAAAGDLRGGFEIESAERGADVDVILRREIKTARSDATVFQQACPLLVPLVEEGWQQRPETMRIIRQYVRSLKQQRIDTLILGCTHYPMLEKQFRSAMGRRVVILDSPKIVAEKLAAYLQRHPEIEKKLSRVANHRFVVTDITQPLERNTQQWLGEKIVLQKIMLST